MTTAPMTTMLESALQYARNGWQIFPVHSHDGICCSCGKPECSSPGKHPRTRRGVKDATDREDMVQYWWGRWPHANIGVATGEGSGLWVLDVDVAVDQVTGELLKDGEASLRDAGLDVSSTIESRTGGGGRHLIFGWDGDAPPVGCRGGVLTGVDVRGNGGYIVAPPSRHASGRDYQWISPPWDVKPSQPGVELMRIVLGNSPLQPAAPPPVAQDAPAPAPVAEQSLDPELAQALQVIPPDCGYEEWLAVAMGLHDETAGSEAGFALFHGWSAGALGAQTPSGHPAYRGEADCRAKWASLGGRPNPIGRGSLFQLALRYGFVSRTLADPAGGGSETPAWGAGRPEWIWSRWEPVPFPIDRGFPPALDWLREILSRIAWCYQVPVDLPVMLAMPIAMAALSAKVAIKVPGETWTEPAVLWTLVALTSGGRKSPVHRALIEPVREWERKLDNSGAIGRHKAALAVAEMRVAKATKLCGSKAAEDSEEQGRIREAQLAEAMQKVELIKATSIPTQELIAHEATTERLVELMARQQGRVLVSDAEGDIFDVAMGRYSSSVPNLGAWLKGYDGDTIKQERVSGDRIVHRPLINVGVATQPEALQFLTDKVANGRGFVARFCVAIVQPQATEDFLSGREVTPAELAPWGERLTQLLSRVIPDQPDEITLSADAYRQFKAWGQALMSGAERIEADEGESPKDAWFRKYPGKVLRIALLLHCLQADGLMRPEVDLQTMEAAIAWGDYIAAQNASLGAITRQDPDLRIAEKILRWVDRQELADGRFTRRGLARALCGGHGRSIQRTRDLDGPLAALVDDGWLRPSGRPASGGRGPTAPSVAYECHPALHAALGEQRAREDAEREQRISGRQEAKFTRW